MSQTQKVEAGTRPLNESVWINARLLDAARLIFIGAIFTAVWGIGGYYPTARFVTLALLSGSAALLFLGSYKPPTARDNTVALFLVMSMTIVYGLLQLLPQSLTPFLEWTGVREVQVRFGSNPEAPELTQSLVVWATQSWLAMAVIGLSGFFLATQLFRDDSSRILLLVAIGICGIGQVLWGIAQLTTYPDMIFLGVENPSRGSVAFGTFLNRNHAADFIAVALACCVGIARARSLSSSKRQRSGYGVSTGFQAVLTNPITLSIWLSVICLTLGLILSMSRGGWVSSIIALVVVILCWRRSGQKPRYGLLAGIVTAITIAFFSLQFFGFGDQVGDRIDDLEVSNVLADSRFAHWSDAMPAVAHYFPFGSGVGTYGHAYLPLDPVPQRRWFTHAHNQYLEVLVEAGIPGVLLLLFGLFIAIRTSLLLCGDDRSASKQAIGIAAMAAVVLHAFHAITDFGLMMPGNLLVLAAIVGAASSAGAKRSRVGKTKPRSIQPATMTAQTVTPNAAGPSSMRQSILVRVFSPAIMTLLVLIALGVALWQQGRAVSADRMLGRTAFVDSTPSPTIQVSQEKLAMLRDELDRWPAFEPLQRRIIQMQTHQSRRAIYDQIRKAQASQADPVDPLIAWNSTSFQAVIARLFDNSVEGTDEATRAAIEATMKNDPLLVQAWEDLQHSLLLNPVQPRTHLQIALLAAVTGRQWRQAFDRSIALSVVNNNQSLGNGLLAWAADDKASMIDQWKQNLSTGSDQIQLIYELSRVRLDDDEFIDQVLPNRWVVPFRLAQNLKDDEATKELREKLLKKSEQIANSTLIDDADRNRTQGMIASAREDYSDASSYFAKAIKSNPKDAQTRYLAAVALYRAGDAKQAAKQANFASLLEPKNRKFRDLHRRAKKLHKQQLSNQLKMSDDTSQSNSN